MTTNQWLRASPLLILLALSMALAMGLFNTPVKSNNARIIGRKIAPVELPILDNPNMLFSANTWKGKVAVINVFVSWSEPCQAEHEALMNLAKTGKVAIYGVAWRDKAPNVAKWLQERGNPYQIIANDEHGSSTIPLSITSVPETLVVGKDGVVRFYYSLPLTDEIVNSKIIPLVEELNAK